MIIEKNMEYNIFFNSEKIINKDISKIPKQNLDLIFSKLDNFKNNPLNNSQIKKLNNYNLCDYRLRVWDFRILFNIDTLNNRIVVFRILHRSKLY